jgi:uncharacterized protein (DUF1697 family)
MTGNRYVLLLRGINVNPSTRVAMADLRELVSELGYTDVKTILQSGNVILSSASEPSASKLDAAIFAKTGVKSRVVVLPLSTVSAIAQANPLLDVSDDLSKMVITFFDSDIDPAAIERPTDEELAPERLVITKNAMYQWCPEGILGSKLKPAWWKQFGPLATSRNVRTVNRILDAATAA